MTGRRVRSAALATVLIAVGALLWITLAGTRPEPPAEVSAEPETPRPSAISQESQAAPAIGEEGARRSVPVAAAAEPLLVILDDESGQPVEGAAIFASVGKRVRTMSPRLPILARSDAEGSVYARDLGERTAFVVKADGYVAAHVTVGGSGVSDPAPGDVRLRKGYEALVSVVAADHALLAGKVVCLIPQNTTLTLPQAYEEPGFGNPECEAWIHVGFTGDDGVATLTDVPPGDCMVRSSVINQCARERVGITVPGPGVTIQFDEIFGVVALPAADAEIARCRFVVDWDQLHRSICARSQLHSIEAQMRERFPGAAVYVAQTLHRQVIPVEITAVLNDGSIAKASWALQPLSKIDEPVYLEVVERRGCGTLRVEIQRDGRSWPDLPLVAYRAEHSIRERFVSGSSTMLPVGEYSIHPLASMAWLDEAFKGKSAVIRSGVDTVVEVELPWNLTEVTVNASLTYGVSDVPIHVGYIHHDLRISAMSANHMPWMPPAHFWFPPGRVEISADAAHIERIYHALQITGEEVGPIEMAITVGE